MARVVFHFVVLVAVGQEHQTIAGRSRGGQTHAGSLDDRRADGIDLGPRQGIIPLLCRRQLLLHLLDLQILAGDLHLRERGVVGHQLIAGQNALSLGDEDVVDLLRGGEINRLHLVGANFAVGALVVSPIVGHCNIGHGIDAAGMPPGTDAVGNCARDQHQRQQDAYHRYDRFTFVHLFVLSHTNTIIQ